MSSVSAARAMPSIYLSCLFLDAPALSWPAFAWGPTISWSVGISQPGALSVSRRKVAFSRFVRAWRSRSTISALMCSGPESLIFVAVGVSCTLLGALMRGGSQVLLALEEHGGVEQGAQQVGQSIDALHRKLLHYGR